MEKYFTCLRGNLRKYLEEEISAGRLDFEKAKVLAAAIHQSLTHNLLEQTQIDAVTQKLVAQYPELQNAFLQAGLYCTLDNNKIVVDDEVIKLVEANQLDDALSLLKKIKK